jgi:hypothetical protein
MANFFPRQTIEWRLDEPPAFRRLSLSLVEMALLTGVVLRLLRAFAFTHGRASVLFSIGAVAVWAIVLIGMTTAHMANYPLRRWAWRGPLFGLMETVGEMLTSLVLIALHREPNGTARAEFHDWPTMGARALLHREKCRDGQGRGLRSPGPGAAHATGLTALQSGTFRGSRDTFPT